MHIVRRLIRVWEDEGLSGITKRVARRVILLNFRLAKLLKFPSVRSVYGLKFTANYSDITFNLYIVGAYGFYYWDRLQSIDFKFVFLDIGANQGLYAIGSTLNQNLIRTYAFEPVSQTYDLLKNNVLLNSVSTKCSTVKKAISDRNGFGEISLSRTHSGGATLSTKNTVTTQSTEVERIELIDGPGLQSLIDEKDYPMIVKIDVEGFEATVIQELMRADFAPNIREIYFEVDEHWIDVTYVKNFLVQWGFTNFTKIGSGRHYDLLAERKTTPLIGI